MIDVEEEFDFGLLNSSEVFRLFVGDFEVKVYFYGIGMVL